LPDRSRKIPLEYPQCLCLWVRLGLTATLSVVLTDSPLIRHWYATLRRSADVWRTSGEWVAFLIGCVGIRTWVHAPSPFVPLPQGGKQEGEGFFSASLGSATFFHMSPVGARHVVPISLSEHPASSPGGDQPFPWTVINHLMTEKGTHQTTVLPDRFGTKQKSTAYGCGNVRLALPDHS
jgi:hypothetical protein